MVNVTIYIYISQMVQCEAPKIAKLVPITPIIMVFVCICGTYNELVTGAYKPTNITGGPHIVGLHRYCG